MMNLARTTNDELLPRECSRCASIVPYAAECKRCLDFFNNRPHPSSMTDDERADEILSWGISEIDFVYVYQRIQELLGRELFKHELYEECGSVESLALEVRRGAQLSLVGVFAKALLIEDGEPIPLFASDSSGVVSEFLDSRPELADASMLVIMAEMERAQLDFDIVYFRPDHEFLVEASSPDFDLNNFIEQLKGSSTSK